MNTTDAAYRFAVEDRYKVVRLALAIDRRRLDWGMRFDQTAALRAERRALVRIRWFARAMERVMRPAPAAYDYHAYQARGPVTEDDLLAGYGVDPDYGHGDREGDPAFNGAFSKW